MSARPIPGAFLLLVLFSTPLPGSWVLLHESGERLEGETRGKRRISQENLLEDVALSYDVKQEQEPERARVQGMFWQDETAWKREMEAWTEDQ